MKLVDNEEICIKKIQLVVNVKSLPIGTHIRRDGSGALFDRFFFCDKVGAIQSWNGKSIAIENNDIVFIPRKLGYYDEITAKGNSIILYIDTNFQDTENITKWSFASNPKIKKSFLLIYDLWRQQKSGYYLHCMSELYKILNMIWRSEKTSYTSSHSASAIAPAVEFLRSNYNNPDFDIPSLANKCDLSYSHFRKLFYDVYKMPAKTYLQKLRIEQACKILSTGDSTIAETALLSGFKDAFYFSNFFKKHMGMYPSEYMDKIKS